MVGTLVAELGWRAGQKAAATIGTKVATVVTAAIASRAIISGFQNKEAPIEEIAEKEPDAAVKTAFQRTVRDAAITGLLSGVGIVIFKIADIAIEETD